MTKKHFQDIAYALMLARPHPDASPDASDAWWATVALMADVCAQHNALFDRGKFYAAAQAERYTPSLHGR